MSSQDADLKTALDALHASCADQSPLRHFHDVCEIYKQSEAWAPGDEAPWTGLDEQLGAESIDAIDEAILKKISAKKSGKDQQRRLKFLRKTGWSLRPYQVLRDLGEDGLGCPRPLGELFYDVCTVPGHEISWVRVVEAIKRAADKRRQHPGKGHSRQKEVERSDVKNATEELLETLGVGASGAVAVANSKAKRTSAEDRDGNGNDASDGEGAESESDEIRVQSAQGVHADDDTLPSDSGSDSGLDVDGPDSPDTEPVEHQRRTRKRRALDSDSSPFTFSRKRNKRSESISTVDQDRRRESQHARHAHTPIPDESSFDLSNAVFPDEPAADTDKRDEGTMTPSHLALDQEEPSSDHEQHHGSPSPSSMNYFRLEPLPSSPEILHEHPAPALQSSPPPSLALSPKHGPAEPEAATSRLHPDTTNATATTRDSPARISNSEPVATVTHAAIDSMMELPQSATPVTTRASLTHILNPEPDAAATHAASEGSMGTSKSATAASSLLENVTMTPWKVAEFLAVDTKPGQKVVENSVDGMVESLQPGMWLSASTVYLAMCALNPAPLHLRTYESGFLDRKRYDVTRDRASLAKYDRHYCPIFNSSHWTIAMIDSSAGTHEIYDSLGKQPSINIRNTVQDFAQKVTVPSLSSAPIPSADLRQGNLHDCGIFVWVCAVMHMHQRPYPSSIIPDVWRRTLILYLGGPAGFSSSPFCPANIFQRLREAFSIQCTPDPEGHLALDADAPCEKEDLRKLRECLLLLQAECQSILDLWDQRYDSKAVIDWYQQQKNEMPRHFNQLTKDEHSREFDQRIAENQKVYNMMADYDHNAEIVRQTLKDDIRKYQDWAKEVGRIGCELWDQEIQKLEALLAKANASKAAMM